MSDKKKQNLNEKDHGSDDKQIENLEAGNAETDFANTFEVNQNSSGTAHHMLQQNETDNTQVNLIDVITVEDLSHDSLENSSGNSQYKVIEFPSDDENETDSHFSHICADNMGGVSFERTPQEPNENEFVLASTKKRKRNMIEVVDTESLNKKPPDATCTTETWGELELKRRKDQISLTQNKRHKEIPNPCIPVIQCPNTDAILEVQSSSSGEFADAEDSSSSDNNASNSLNITKQMPLKSLSSGIQQIKERKIECINQEKSTKVESSCLSSPNKSSQKDHFGDKTEENTVFPSYLKGETLPVFKLTDEAKKKFELSMPTIFEVRESDSDEKIPQPLQSKTNPLKMKTKVGKRRDKCNVCNVRLGLCAIECRCGGYYCAKHRYDKEHNCTFDYKTMGADEIRKNNPRIVAEKIRKL